MRFERLPAVLFSACLLGGVALATEVQPVAAATTTTSFESQPSPPPTLEVVPTTATSVSNTTENTVAAHSTAQVGNRISASVHTSSSTSQEDSLADTGSPAETAAIAGAGIALTGMVLLASSKKIKQTRTTIS